LKRRYVTIDVFTDRMFGGNPLAVVLDAAGLSTSQMQAIAIEFNYSETTFILPPRHRDHSAWVRIFTPGSEIPFAAIPISGLPSPSRGYWPIGTRGYPSNSSSRRRPGWFRLP